MENLLKNSDSISIAENLLSEIIADTMKQARYKQLLSMVDSFGVNFNLENSVMTVCWENQVWDANKDDYPYDEDREEPVSILFDLTFNLASCWHRHLLRGAFKKARKLCAR